MISRGNPYEVRCVWPHRNQNCIDILNMVEKKLHIHRNIHKSKWVTISLILEGTCLVVLRRSKHFCVQCWIPSTPCEYLRMESIYSISFRIQKRPAIHFIYFLLLDTTGNVRLIQFVMCACRCARHAFYADIFLSKTFPASERPTHE